MGVLKTLSNGQVVTLLDGDELGDAGDVLMRVGADGAAYRPVSDVAAAWGGITGTLSAQTDLQSALDAKAAASTAILHQATVELTDAQIKALPTTGVQIVAAPGVNKMILWQTARVILNASAGGYTFPAGASWQLLIGTREDSGIIPLDTADDEAVTFQFPPYLGLGSGDFTGYLVSTQKLTSERVNVALSIKDNYNGVANYTGGNAANRLRVSVTYYVLNTLTGVFE